MVGYWPLLCIVSSFPMHCGGFLFWGIMNNRNVIKQDLRTIAEIGIVSVLGKVPRKFRRASGRIFANEALRAINGLPAYNKRANRAIIDWIVKEWDGIEQQRLHEISGGDPESDPSNHGGEAAPLADNGVEGQRLDDFGVGEISER